jgi:hypothetical protein
MADQVRRRPSAGPTARGGSAGDGRGAQAGAAIEAKREPPVVARLVVEIRSDGSHTIARGAAEDAVTGERVTVQAEGATPLALILSLLKSALELPTLARTFTKGFLPRK